MKDLGLAQDVSLIALNDQEVKQMPNSKRASLRGMAAAVILELYLNDYFIMENDEWVYEGKKDDSSLTAYQYDVITTMLGKKEREKKSFSTWLENVKSLSKNQLAHVEKAFVEPLKNELLLEEIPSLRSCDLEFETAGISINVYWSHSDAYTKVLEGFRADVLEEAPITDEAISMLWLLKESGFFPEIFSKHEMNRVSERLQELQSNSPLAKQLFSLDIHSFKEKSIKGFLKKKKEVMSTQVGAGINFIFPELQRSEAVFIDTNEYFANKDARLNAVKNALTKHRVPHQIIQEGDVPIIQVNNTWYDVVPFTKQYRMPVHGVQFRRHPLSTS